jgi:hypothetical protein
VRVDARRAEDPTQAAVEAAAAVPHAGAVLRVIVQMRADQQAQFRENAVRTALAGAADVSVAREVEVETRARLGNLAPEALTPTELVERYFQSRGADGERIRSLLAKCEDLLRDSG